MSNPIDNAAGNPDVNAPAPAAPEVVSTPATETPVETPVEDTLNAPAADAPVETPAEETVLENPADEKSED